MLLGAQYADSRWLRTGSRPQIDRINYFGNVRRNPVWTISSSVARADSGTYSQEIEISKGTKYVLVVRTNQQEMSLGELGELGGAAFDCVSSGRPKILWKGFVLKSRFYRRTPRSKMLCRFVGKIRGVFLGVLGDFGGKSLRPTSEKI
jgi:hypothetical protein